MSAIQRAIPVALQQQLANSAIRTRQNAEAIYGLLDAKQCPVKVADIQNELGIGPVEYKNARQLLESTTDAEVYVTQDGLALKKYLTDDQRYWHLAWGLGLLKVSGEQLVMDEDLLLKVPAALKKLLKEKNFRKHDHLSALQGKARQMIGTLGKVLTMYREVDRQLGAALLGTVRDKSFDDAMEVIQKQLKASS